MADFNCDLQEKDFPPISGLAIPDAITYLLKKKKGYADPGDIDSLTETLSNRLQMSFYGPGEIAEIGNSSALLRKVRSRGLSVCLSSSLPRPVLDVLLEALSWSEDDHYDHSVASDEVLRGRPYGDMIKEAMEFLDVQSSSQVVHVGDSPADLRAGRNAGCGLVVAVSTGLHSRDDLSAYSHDAILDDLGDLEPLIFPITQHA